MEIKRRPPTDKDPTIVSFLSFPRGKRIRFNSYHSCAPQGHNEPLVPHTVSSECCMGLEGDEVIGLLYSSADSSIDEPNSWMCCEEATDGATWKGVFLSLLLPLLPVSWLQGGDSFLHCTTSALGPADHGLNHGNHESGKPLSAVVDVGCFSL